MRTNVNLLLILLLGLIMYACKSGQGEKYGYQRTALTTEQRVNDLLGRMSLEEKVTGGRVYVKD